MSERNGVEGRLLKLGLVGTFLAAIGIAGTREQPGGRRFGVTDLGMLGLASHRIGRMLAFERVALPLREPFTATVPDETGVSDTVVARGRGVQWTIGELVSCPTCVGTWAALWLYIGMTVLPGPTRVLVRVLATAQVAELTFGAVEVLEWGSRAARRHAG